MKIVQLITDWFYTPDGDGFDHYEVGKNEIKEIREHLPQGEGDRLWYDVEYENGNVKRLYNPNSVSFVKEKK